jgi:hypothetical protein
VPLDSVIDCWVPTLGEFLGAFLGELHAI